MATCADYRTIEHLFGVAKCTVCTIIHDTYAAFVKVFLSRIIKFPTVEALKRTIAGFDLKWQFIQCAGAIDGCHIPVKPPSQHHTDSFFFWKPCPGWCQPAHAPSHPGLVPGHPLK